MQNYDNEAFMKLTFFGDTILQENDTIAFSKEFLKLVKQSDFNILNFEGTLKDSSSLPISKIGPNLYNSDKSIEILKENFFNVFVLSNNHIVDFGSPGFKKTLKELDKNGIYYCGAGLDYDSAYKPLILNKEGEKVAIINCCHAEFGVYKDKNIPLNCGYAWINNKQIEENIVKCKKDGCFVIVVAHAGVEFIPLPLPEWREKYKSFIVFGADLVIGGHPHIVQGKEIYKNKPIYYSLGNFLFSRKDKKEDVDWNVGLIVSLDTKTGECAENFSLLKDSKISIQNSESIKNIFLERSQILCDDSLYYKKIDVILENLWNNTYKPLYDAVSNFINCRNGLFKNLLKFFAKKYIFKSKFQKDLNEVLLLHNIQIESHRYAVERYLYRKNCEVNGLLE